MIKLLTKDAYREHDNSFELSADNILFGTNIDEDRIYEFSYYMLNDLMKRINLESDVVTIRTIRSVRLKFT